MLYRPNFCNHCGEKVERIEWKLWTSRRFCETCELLQKQEDWKPRILLGLAVVGGLFGFGTYLTSTDKSPNLTASKFVANTAPRQFENSKIEKPLQVANLSNTQNMPMPQANIAKETIAPRISPKVENAQEKSLENQQNSPAEPVYFCGAQTKKGTPCTRKVKGGGRCWQHTGAPSMLPEKKLLAKAH